MYVCSDSRGSWKTLYNTQRQAKVMLQSNMYVCTYIDMLVSWHSPGLLFMYKCHKYGAKVRTVYTQYICTYVQMSTNMLARQVLLYSVRACVCVCVCVPVCSSLGVRIVDMKGIHSSNMAAHPSEVLLSLERHCSHHWHRPTTAVSAFEWTSEWATVLHDTSEGDTANTGHRGHLTWAIYRTCTAAKPFKYIYVCRIAVPTEEKCTYEHCEAVLLIHLLLRTYIQPLG